MDEKDGVNEKELKQQKLDTNFTITRVGELPTTSSVYYQFPTVND